LIARLAARVAAMLSLFLLLLAQQSLAEMHLTPHKAEYAVKISVLGGQLNTELQATPDGYIATHIIKPTGMSRILANGSIIASSAFTRGFDGFRPWKYHTNDTLTRERLQADIEFDWENGAASGVVNNEDFASQIPGMAYDPISIQYELMSDLMSGKASDGYVLFELDELKTISVRLIGSRSVSVPAGKFEAVGIQHQSEGSKRITTMWCVKELDYLPVIIEQHRNGKLRMRAQLKSYLPSET
jgi:hypothetical protein